MIFEGNGKSSAFVDFTFYFNLTMHIRNVIVNQIETNTMTVNIVMEFLIKTKDFVFDFIGIKTSTVIGKN